jgi:hypothetical protein
MVKIAKQGSCSLEEIIPDKLLADRKRALQKGKSGLTENSLMKKSGSNYVLSAELLRKWILTTQLNQAAASSD